MILTQFLFFFLLTPRRNIRSNSFVGDIHQPLHSSRVSDKGGNDYHVKFDFPMKVPHVLRNGSHHHNKWNLHSVWDTGIIELALSRDYGGSREAFEMELIQASKSMNYTDDVARWLKCADGRDKQCTIEWGEESFLVRFFLLHVGYCCRFKGRG